MIALLFMAAAASGGMFTRPFSLAGSGQMSCATAFSASQYPTTRAWITGFFSGANAIYGGHVGRQTDGEGLIAEVELTCRARPSDTLAQATLDTYSRMSSK